MLRFGCRAGLAGLLVLAWLAGCNSDNSDEPVGPETSRPSVGGGASSFATLEQAVGRVLVVGESAAVPHFEREYRGLAQQAKTGAELVRCELISSPNGFIVSIEAAEASSPTPQFAARLLAPSLEPAMLQATPDSTDENTVRVRLGDGDAFSYYEYELDNAGDPATLCSVGLSAFDRDHVVGKVACRRLLASPGSLDFTPAGSADPGSASVTIDFHAHFARWRRRVAAAEPATRAEPAWVEPTRAEPAPLADERALPAARAPRGAAAPSRSAALA